MKLISRMIVAAMALSVFAASARAQGVGVRAGASADPDQFYAGVHVETREPCSRSISSSRIVCRLLPSRARCRCGTCMSGAARR